MTPKSPFADSRFEYEVKHLYYLEKTVYDLLQQAKPCYLFGSRGTGKTTLLRSLSWRERVKNEGLKEQLRGRIFKDFIGIYIKLPEIHLEAISNWLRKATELQQRMLYSRYLELIQLQEILDAVAGLQSEAVFSFSADDEAKLVANLLTEYSDELFLTEPYSRVPTSLAELSKSVWIVRRTIERGSQRELPPSEILDRIGNPQQFNVLSRGVTERLVTLLTRSNAPKGIFFKVCFDEAETLDSLGVRTLSTWVRTSSSPLFHVISFVSKPEDLGQTFSAKLTVQSADATTIPLDEVSGKNFRALAEGVATLRVREFVRRYERNAQAGDDDLRFECDRVFGRLNLNQLLRETLKTSESLKARELLIAAQRRLGHPEIEADTEKQEPPIYETYLASKRALDRGTEPTTAWHRRRESSASARKAMVAAYLSIFAELELEPKYAFADMVLQCSDGCIRDFLNHVEHIFRQLPQASVLDFVQRTLPVSTTAQNAGIHAASAAKYESLPVCGVNHPASVAKVVGGLGQLTKMLQSSASDGIRHLRSTERGLFWLAQSTGEVYRDALEFVRDGSEAGFLKIVETVDAGISFRVHTSLAARYGFSYRGAYYRVPLSAHDVLELARSESEADVTRRARVLFTRIDGQVGSLFQERIDE